VREPGPSQRKSLPPQQSSHLLGKYGRSPVQAGKPARPLEVEGHVDLLVETRVWIVVGIARRMGRIGECGLGGMRGGGLDGGDRGSVGEIGGLWRYSNGKVSMGYQARVLDAQS